MIWPELLLSGQQEETERNHYNEAQVDYQISGIVEELCVLIEINMIEEQQNVLTYEVTLNIV